MSKCHSVLIVDDDPRQRHLLETALRCDGFHISEAHDGIACLTAVQRHTPDIILMDVKMPRLDGIGACRRLRRMKQNQNLPIVLITALNDASTIKEGFSAGATDYLTKPVNVTLIGYRIKALLQEKETQQELLHDKKNYIQLQQELGIGYWTWDLVTEQFHWSESLAQQLGLTLTEVEATREGFLDSVHYEDRVKLTEEIEQGMKKGEGFWG